MSQAASGTYETNLGEEGRLRKGCRKGRKRWSAYEIIAMVAGFIIFWPLGLLALFLKLWNGEMWKGAAEGTTPWASWKMPSTESGAPRATAFLVGQCRLRRLQAHAARPARGRAPQA